MESNALAIDRSAQARFVSRLARLPWWLLIILFAGVFLFYKIQTDELYSTILQKLSNGIVTTLKVALFSYTVAIVIGLIAGLGRVSKNPVVYNLATLYVQIIRGVPILVQILYVAFVLGPIFFQLVNWLGTQLAGVLGPDNFLLLANTQDFSMETRVMLALAIAYGGF